MVVVVVVVVVIIIVAAVTAAYQTPCTNFIVLAALCLCLPPK